MIHKVQKGAESPSNPVSSDPTSCLGEKPILQISPVCFQSYSVNMRAVSVLCAVFLCFYFTVHFGDCVISLKQALPRFFYCSIVFHFDSCNLSPMDENLNHFCPFALTSSAAISSLVDCSVRGGVDLKNSFQELGDILEERTVKLRRPFPFKTWEG